MLLVFIPLRKIQSFLLPPKRKKRRIVNRDLKRKHNEITQGILKCCTSNTYYCEENDNETTFDLGMIFGEALIHRKQV